MQVLGDIWIKHVEKHKPGCDMTRISSRLHLAIRPKSLISVHREIDVYNEVYKTCNHFGEICPNSSWEPSVQMFPGCQRHGYGIFKLVHWWTRQPDLVRGEHWRPALAPWERHRADSSMAETQFNGYFSSVFKANSNKQWRRHKGHAQNKIPANTQDLHLSRLRTSFGSQV